MARGAGLGAHGRFDGRSLWHSAQLWASQRHGTLAVVGAGMAAGVAVLARRARG